MYKHRVMLFEGVWTTSILKEERTVNGSSFFFPPPFFYFPCSLACRSSCNQTSYLLSLLCDSFDHECLTFDRVFSSVITLVFHFFLTTYDISPFLNKSETSQTLFIPYSVFLTLSSRLNVLTSSSLSILIY